MRGHVLFGSSASVSTQTSRQNHFRLYCCQVKFTKREIQECSQCHKYSWGENEQAYSIGELLHFWLVLQVSCSHCLVCYDTSPDPLVTHCVYIRHECCCVASHHAITNRSCLHLTRQSDHCKSICPLC